MSQNSLRVQAYRHVQRKILSGEIPPGGKVSEQAIAEELGISRTPVRSALAELESEGLLEQVPRYGTIVRRADRRDLVDLFDLRRALESFAAEMAAPIITAEDLSILDGLCDRMYEQIEQVQSAQRELDDDQILSRFVDADMEFHLVILRSTGNRRLMQSVAGSRLLSECGRHARQRPRIVLLSEAWQGHRRILAALKAGDAEAARKEMAEHIEFSKTNALRVFDRLQAEGDAKDAWEPNRSRITTAP